MEKFIFLPDGSVASQEYYNNFCEPKAHRCSSFIGVMHSKIKKEGF